MKKPPCLTGCGGSIVSKWVALREHHYSETLVVAFLLFLLLVGGNAGVYAQLVFHASELAVFTQDANQLAVSAGVTGQAFGLLQEIGFTREIAYQATGFGNQQAASSHVPDAQARFKEAIGKASGDVGQIQRSSAGAAHASSALRDFSKHAHVSAEVVAGTEGETGGDQAVL